MKKLSCKKIVNKLKNTVGIGNVLVNVNATFHEKNCLLVYIKQPFENEEDNYSHQNINQVRSIAKIIGQFGYNVDVIDYRTKKVKLNKDYDAVFDICVRDHPVYENNLKSAAKRIAYFTGSESVFANNAELSRIKELKDRRGINLLPRRQAPLISKRVEWFDEVILIGNEYNLSTYKNFQLPKTYLVPNTGYDFGNRFDLSKKKKTNFLYFGSFGCVHKGLDLLLEIFAEEHFPCTLFVCGSFMHETDFRKAYEEELYHTPNIKPIGFINIWSDLFFEVCSKCTYAVLPSCSEARAGTVATCLSAGVIPICSRECGYEADEVIMLQDCKKETIREAVLNASKQTDEWITEMRNRSFYLAEHKYNMTEFNKCMYMALKAVF